MTAGYHTHLEISSQPSVWRSTLKNFFETESALAEAFSCTAKKTILVTGCGSTYALSLAAAALLREKGLNAWAFPASEIKHFPDILPQGDVDLLTISRSGTTTETLWAIDVFRKHYPQGKVYAITTLPQATQATVADYVLSAPDAAEISIAQTRSFSSMLLLAQAFAGAVAKDRPFLKNMSRLPDALEDIFVRYPKLPEQIGTDTSLQRFFFLGEGPLYGIAMECMIKTKELTLSWAEAYHPLEFRHGPMSIIDKSALVISLISDSGYEAERRVLKDMKALGATTMAILEDVKDADWSCADYVVELHSHLDEWQRTALYLPLVQWIAYYRSLRKGLDPDQPTNLSMVVELSE